MTRRLQRRCGTSAPGTTRPPACPRRVPQGLHLRTVWGCGPDARLRKRDDRLRGALWQAGWGGFAWRRAFRGWVRVKLAPRLRTARQSRHRPPTRPRGGRTSRETRQNLPVDALRPVWQEWDGMNESEKQFSFTRVASSTSGHAKKQIPISESRHKEEIHDRN